MIRICAWSSPGEIRCAVVDGGVLEEYAIWRPGRPDGVGDIYRARVAARVPALGGAFLELPEGTGFLPDNEGAAEATEGAVLTVRVVRAAQGGKGPRLSARLAQEPGAPGLVAHGPGPLLEMADRHRAAPVLADDYALLASLGRTLGGRLALAPATDDDLAEQIAALSRAEIDLPGGMRASITPTPALVAIDMDTAAASAGREKEAAQLAANRAALPALLRQIRLRNLSGAILIDLAGMRVKRRPLLGATLTTALADDPLRPRFLGFTALGLAEIVRPRVRPPLHELLSGPHAAGLDALRAMADEATVTPHVPLTLRAAPDVLAALDADTVAKADLARRTGRPFIGITDPTLPRHAWRIEREHRA